IGAGRFAPGTRLPTEAELAARFGANRHTVRRALSHLAAEGRVRARRGSGTFVTDAPELNPITARTRFSEIADGIDRSVTAESLSHHIEPASDAVAHRLGLAPETDVLVWRTRRTIGPRWASLATHWLPAAPFDGLVEAFAQSGSLTAAFAQLGYENYARARSEISAGLADMESAPLLDMEPGDPILIVRALDVDANGAPLQLLETRFAADVISLLVETEPSPG
ncbi:MAG: phosphonate metabolism transcriptional regulator PhnF, partial [Pseudomonadota bacterium]